MKKTICIILATAFAATLQAAVPLAWSVETTRAQPAAFDCYRGETLDLRASLYNAGTALDVSGAAANLYWQTNGMGEVYWSAPATAASNVLSATWAPTNDVGAANYNCFIGVAGEIYRAAFRLRMLPSPGAVPSELDLPAKSIDFAAVTVFNAPYYTQGEADSALAAAAQSATNYTDSTASTLRDSIATKQDSISDLATIREGAALGATALQSYTETDPVWTAEKGGYATTNALADKANDADVVHTTGNETIVGNKTFYDGIIMENGADIDFSGGRVIIRSGDSVAVLNHDGIDYSTDGGYNYEHYDWPSASGKIALTAGTGHNGNLAALDANGNPVDSGKSAADFATAGALSAAAGAATNYTDSTASTLRDSISSIAQSATNYTDSALAAAATASTNYTDAAVLSAATAATNYTDTKTATKQDKLPYPTNAIPQGAVSGLSTALDGKVEKSDFNTATNLFVKKSGDAMAGSLSTPSLTVPDINQGDIKIENGQIKHYDWGYLGWRTYSLPYESGTFALQSDISSQVAAAAQSATNYTAYVAQSATNYTDSTASTLRDSISTKQDTISDLAAIRSGAALGATALQSYTETDPTVPAWAKAASKPTYAYSEITGKPTFATVATSGSYNDLTDKPTIPSPTAPVASATLAWQSNGSAIVVSVGAAETLSTTLTGWIDGQTQTALITLAAGASVAANVKLVGYGTWPTSGQFLASATRVGNFVYVTPIVLVN